MSYASDLKLGQEYYDQRTGLTGHLVAVHFYEYACERGTLRYVNGQGDPVEATFDAPELVHVETGQLATASKPGGPARNEGRR